MTASTHKTALENSLGVHIKACPHGTFDVALDAYYQSDEDFQKSIALWNRFLEPEITMSSPDLENAHALLPDVPKAALRELKTKCNKSCACGRENNALDLIRFCVTESIHGTRFLTQVLTETRPNKKISIIDSCHKSNDLPASVVYLDDTKPIPCADCGEDVHLYLLHHALAHYWHGEPVGSS
jgi:hypothetical protein